MSKVVSLPPPDCLAQESARIREREVFEVKREKVKRILS